MKRVVYKSTTHMLFSDYPILDTHTILLTNVIPCLSSEYIKILNRSCTVTTMHKALVYSNHSNTKCNGNKIMIDILNAESSKYSDQNNIDAVQLIFNKNISTCMRARDFQGNYVASWNKSAPEVSMLLDLELSTFDEISNDSSVQVLIELLHDYGLINKDTGKHGHYSLVENIGKRRMRINGNCLSMEKIRQVKMRVYSAITHPGKAAFVQVTL